MNKSEVRSKIKQIIANVTSLDPAGIADDASFREDLGLDSLSLLEIGVDVDYEFKLGIENLDEQMTRLVTVDQAADLVLELLAERQSAASAAG